MSKHQEALNKVYELISDLDFGSQLKCADQLKIIQELVDKATPKKPKIEQQNDYVEHNYVCSYELAFCPDCDLRINFDEDYCKRCGQKFDWSEEDEE